jgi:hypothetical protein
MLEAFVPSPEVIQPTLRIAFFAGELVANRVVAVADLHRTFTLPQGHCFRESWSLPWLCFFSRSSRGLVFASGFCFRMAW